MADKPKPPRKIKDLKARLGRTIAPNTPGAEMPEGVPAPAGAASPGVVKPPPSAAKGLVPPKGVVPPGGVVAPAGVTKAGPSGPFAAPKPSVPAPSNDPFAASAPSVAPGPREVRLVLDDSAVDDSEVGRKKKGRTLMLLAMGLVLGVLLGFGTGSVMNDRKTHNAAVRDGKDLYDAVREASTKVEEAQRLVTATATAAVGSAGNPPSVDYASIEALRGLEKPFSADVFSRRNYFLFEPATVDQLFSYYSSINEAWSEIEAIVNMTTGEERRSRLNEAAEAQADASALLGCIPAIEEDRFLCSLGFVDIEEVDGSPVAKVRPTRRSRRGVEKTVYSGQDLNDEPDQYVILINNQASAGVLGEQASLFAQYARNIGQLKVHLDHVAELQGQLESALGQVAANEELVAF